MSVATGLKTDAAELLATGSSPQDTANLIAFAAKYPSVVINDRVAPLTLSGGGYVPTGNCFIQGKSSRTRINLFNRTTILQGDYFNGGDTTAWASCTVASDGTSITAPTLSDVKPGDVVVVTSSDILDIEPHYAGGLTEPGEMAIVERVLGTKLFLTQKLIDSYTSSPKVAHLKNNRAGGINPLAIRCGMANIDFEGSFNSAFGNHTYAVEVYTALRPLYENMRLKDSGGIGAWMTIGGNARGIEVDGMVFGGIDYGMALTWCDDFVIDGIVGRNCRHLVTTGGMQRGTTIRIATNRHNIVRNSQGWASGVDHTGISATFTTTSGLNYFTTSTATLLVVGSDCTFSSTGTLPAPLVPATKYFVRSINGNQVSVATSDIAPVVVFSSAGTGTHTVLREDGNTNIIFDTHAESRGMRYEWCTAYLTGESTQTPSFAGGRPIGFGDRGRETNWVNCKVIGDTGAVHRGWVLSSSHDARIVNCSQDKGWVGVTIRPLGGTSQSPIGNQVIGGKFTNIDGEGIYCNSAIGTTIDGVKIENCATLSGSIVFEDTFSRGISGNVVKNCDLPKGVNTFACRQNYQTTNELVYDSNRVVGYDRCSIGLDRGQSGWVGLERKHAKSHGIEAVLAEFPLHALSFLLHLHKPILRTGVILSHSVAITADIMGVVGDVQSSNHVCVFPVGTIVNLPISVIGVSYSPGSDGRLLWHDNSIGYRPTPPGTNHASIGPTLEVLDYSPYGLVARVLRCFTG